MAGYSIEERGAPNSLGYRLYIKDGSGKLVSSMHDIPLKSGEGVYNMVVEVPRWSNAKIEIDLKSGLNPLKQDVKKGKLRYVANCFPHHGYIWNYGAFPQTWEDPNHTDESTGCKGDNDPLDVCEIGQKVHKRGSVVQVKILGTFALIDEGETDWKVLAIDVTDPLAENLNDIHDIEKLMPGFLAATVEWFKIYKMPDGKPANQFAFDDKPKDREFAEGVVSSCHTFWKKLMSGETPGDGISNSNTTLSNNHSIDVATAQDLVAQNPALAEAEPLPDNVDKWHYVSLK
jgi:nucleosome-remodeling factor subunit